MAGARSRRSTSTWNRRPAAAAAPGPLKVNLRNEHLQYALTWFGLAAVLAVAFGFWVRSRAMRERASQPAS